MQNIKRLSLYIFLGLLAYMPLHIFLSTWIGTSFGILSLTKILKDIVLLAGFFLAVVASTQQPWFKKLFRDPLVYMVLAYAALTVLLAAIKPTDQDAEILGVVYNLRFLVFFAYGVLLTKLFDQKMMQQKALRITITVATVVLFFGVVQYALLPDDALRRVGYERGNGVLPAFFIDDKPDLERAMSTLRDPNSLGSYCILIGMLALAFATSKRVPKQLTVGILILSLLCLLMTFSRSAWLGFMVASVVLFAVRYGRQLWHPRYRNWGLVCVSLMVIAAAALFAARDTYLVKNVIFHADESTSLEDPNQLRTRFLKESIKDVAANPTGSGPGTAGLASIRNDVQGTKLNENYYLQIATEVGLVGLTLFVSILGLTGWRLLRLNQSMLALGLFAGFVGLAITNFLVHIWSNEAVAFTWWGLAGLLPIIGARQGDLKSIK